MSVTTTPPSSRPGSKSKLDLGINADTTPRANAAGLPLSFKYPSFKIHQSVTRFCLPLSKFNKLPSNKGKKLIVGALIIVPLLSARPDQPSRSQQSSMAPASDASNQADQTVSPLSPSDSGPSSRSDSGGRVRRKILLVHRAATENDYPDHWEIPGGGAEPGVDQTLLETVVREVKEETGLVVSAILGEFEGFEWSESDTRDQNQEQEQEQEQEEGKRRQYKQYNFIVEVEPNDDGGDDVGIGIGPDTKSLPGQEERGTATNLKEIQRAGRESGEPRFRATPTLNDEEHQAYRWISEATELEGLKMTVNQMKVIKDGLKLIQVGVQYSNR
ncbi:hypothetical protein IAU59_006888 [Kwoniella sp. CBS 9459]